MGIINFFKNKINSSNPGKIYKRGWVEKVINLNHIEMEKIKAKIEWCGDNYSCIIEDVFGIVLITHKTLEGLKKETKKSLKFHIEGLLEDGDPVPDYLINEKYDIEFELQTSAILKQLDGLVTRAALSKASSINERQLGHYFQGKKKAKKVTLQKVIKGVIKIQNDIENTLRGANV